MIKYLNYKFIFLTYTNLLPQKITLGNKSRKANGGIFYGIFGKHTKNIKTLLYEYSGQTGFFVNFGDYIYFKLTILTIRLFSMNFSVNMSPGSWSFIFFLLESKYKISRKLTKNPPLCHLFREFKPDWVVNFTELHALSITKCFIWIFL